MKVLRAADRLAVPWKNGGGVTREVMVSPTGAGFDDFDWRVSIAEVREAGPFSRFPGIHRTLVVLEGRMRLEFADRAVELNRESEQFWFSGEEACHGTPLDGPVIDLNLMKRRGHGHIVRVARGKAYKGLIVAAAATTIGEETLGRFDAAWIEEPVTFDGAGCVIIT